MSTNRPKLKLEVPKNHNLPIKVRLPGEGLPYWKIRTVRQSEVQEAIIVSSRMLTCHGHFVCGGTVPCRQDFGSDCDYCQPPPVGRRKMYLAYLAIWNGKTRAIEIAPLTATAVRGCRALVEDEHLAGRRIKWGRMPGSPKAKVWCLISKDVVEHIPPEKEIEPEYLYRVLLNCWGVELLPVDGKENRRVEVS